MRCLHCGKKISILRRLSDERFCSNEHRAEFERQDGELALGRLLEAQTTHAAVQLPLEATPEPEPEERPRRHPAAGIVVELLTPAIRTPQAPKAEAAGYRPVSTEMAMPAIRRALDETGAEAPPPFCGRLARLGSPGMMGKAWLGRTGTAPDWAVRPVAARVCGIGLGLIGLRLPTAAGVGGEVPPAFRGSDCPEESGRFLRVSIPASIRTPRLALSLPRAEGPPPICRRLARVDVPSSARKAWIVAPESTPAWRVRAVPVRRWRAERELEGLRLPRASEVEVETARMARTTALAASGAPLLWTGSVRTRVPQARRALDAASIEHVPPFWSGLARIAEPESVRLAWAVEPEAAPDWVARSVPARLMGLGCGLEELRLPAGGAEGPPLHLRLVPVLLGSRPDRKCPSEAKEGQGWAMRLSRQPSLRVTAWRLTPTAPGPYAKEPGKRIDWSRFVELARVRWKWAAGTAMAATAILVVMVAAPMEKASAGAGTVARAQREAGLWRRVQDGVSSRAAVRLEDDFRQGLAAWSGEEGWADSWTYTGAGFVTPGRLALYRPSLNLRDYTVSFLGQVEERGLNWVFRAEDLETYYAMRIETTTRGRVPEAAVVRYAVVDGKAGRQTRLPLPLQLAGNTLYPVSLEVRGETFTTRIQDQVVDSFSDSRLRSGGVGFFAGKGDRALLRWVSVVYQDDLIGKFCALLAPPRREMEER